MESSSSLPPVIVLDDDVDLKTEVQNHYESLLIPLEEMETDDDLEEDDLILQNIVIKNKSTNNKKNRDAVVDSNSGLRQMAGSYCWQEVTSSASPQTSRTDEVVSVGTNEQAISGRNSVYTIGHANLSGIDQQQPPQGEDYILKYYCPWRDIMTDPYTPHTTSEIDQLWGHDSRQPQWPIVDLILQD